MEVNVQLHEIRNEFKVVYSKFDSIDQRLSDLEKRIREMTVLMGIFASAMIALVGIIKFI